MSLFIHMFLCVSYAIVLKINIFYKFPSFLLSLHHPLNTKRESMAWGQVGQVVDLTSCCFRVAAVYLLTFVLRFVISTRGVWGGGLEGQTLMVIGCRTCTVVRLFFVYYNYNFHWAVDCFACFLQCFFLRNTLCHFS